MKKYWIIISIIAALVCGFLIGYGVWEYKYQREMRGVDAYIKSLGY